MRSVLLLVSLATLLLGAQPSYISAKVKVLVRLDLTAEVEVEYELRGGGWPSIKAMVSDLAEDASRIALQLLGSKPSWVVEASGQRAVLRGEVEAPAVKLGLNTYELKLGGVEREAVVGERRNLRLLEEVRVELVSYVILEAAPAPSKLAARSAAWSTLPSGASVKFGFLRASLDVTVYGASPCSKPPRLTEGCEYTALIQVESLVGVPLEVEVYIKGFSLRVSRERATLSLEPWGRGELEVRISPERGERWQLAVTIRDKARLEVLSSRLLEGPIEPAEPEKPGEQVEEQPRLLLSASAPERAEAGSLIQVSVAAFNAGGSQLQVKVTLKASGCEPELQSEEVALPPQGEANLVFSLRPVELGQLELEVVAESRGELLAERTLLVEVRPRQKPTGLTPPASSSPPASAKPTPREPTPPQHPPPPGRWPELLAPALAALLLALLLAASILLLRKRSRVRRLR
ncbi:MAG: hypothetical protein DRN99_02770 [Thermoproteota archaeon]|nr:MAG: hypothetical protein DRN99_02770 [Candidatus Korarchaeota archaeon]